MTRWNSINIPVVVKIEQRGVVRCYVFNLVGREIVTQEFDHAPVLVKVSLEPVKYRRQMENISRLVQIVTWCMYWVYRDNGIIIVNIFLKI